MLMKIDVPSLQDTVSHQKWLKSIDGLRALAILLCSFNTARRSAFPTGALGNAGVALRLLSGTTRSTRGIKSVSTFYFTFTANWHKAARLPSQLQTLGYSGASRLKSNF